MGGLPPEPGPMNEGFFSRPTIFADASNDRRLARGELLGPVLGAIRWHKPEELTQAHLRLFARPTVIPDRGPGIP